MDNKKESVESDDDQVEHDAMNSCENNVFKREPCIWDTVGGMSAKGIGMIIAGIILVFLILSLFI